MTELPKGMKVEFDHYRWERTGATILHTQEFRGTMHQPDSRGGETVCVIKDHENNVVASGHAICSPEDNYCKRIGRVKSYGRAMSALENNRPYCGPQPHRQRKEVKFPLRWPKDHDE
jgi:hypothetical protein